MKKDLHSGRERRHRMGYESKFEAIKFEMQIPQPDYASAKSHARTLDDLLGFECAPLENQLYQNQKNLIGSEDNRQYWIGLDLQSLQTPYSEIVEMIQILNPQAGELWLDLGAAYGRIGIVLGFLKPDVRFIGYEFVQERVLEGRRIFDLWDLQQAQIKKADLASKDFELVEADLYFLYDFGSKKDIYDVLEKLRIVAQTKPIRVVARGRGLRNWIPMDFPWLSQINPPYEHGNWTLYKS